MVLETYNFLISLSAATFLADDVLHRVLRLLVLYTIERKSRTSFLIWFAVGSSTVAPLVLGL